jgi:hypothetical protein
VNVTSTKTTREKKKKGAKTVNDRWQHECENENACQMYRYRKWKDFTIKSGNSTVESGYKINNHIREDIYWSKSINNAGGSSDVAGPSKSYNRYQSHFAVKPTSSKQIMGKFKQSFTAISQQEFILSQAADKRWMLEGKFQTCCRPILFVGYQ